MPEPGGGLLDSGSFDKRWVRIERPTIVAGGELTMDMLEVQCSPDTNISEAPLQVKSNCGILVIDDFGRQKMRVDELLNRWIVPLEKRYDFLTMASGKKIQVPFNQMVVFSTNLEPRDLVDDAFLRRIPYKIEAIDPSEDEFRTLFRVICKSTGIPYCSGAIDYLIEVITVRQGVYADVPAQRSSAPGQELLPVQRTGARTQERVFPISPAKITSLLCREVCCRGAGVVASP